MQRERNLNDNTAVFVMMWRHKIRKRLQQEVPGWLTGGTPRSRRIWNTQEQGVWGQILRRPMHT